MAFGHIRVLEVAARIASHEEGLDVRVPPFPQLQALGHEYGARHGCAGRGLASYRAPVADDRKGNEYDQDSGDPCHRLN